MDERMAMATILAEVKRAKRDGRSANRLFLRRETGLTYERIEGLIHQAWQRVME